MGGHSTSLELVYATRDRHGREASFTRPAALLARHSTSMVLLAGGSPTRRWRPVVSPGAEARPPEASPTDIPPGRFPDWMDGYPSRILNGSPPVTHLSRETLPGANAPDTIVHTIMGMLKPLHHITVATRA